MTGEARQRALQDIRENIDRFGYHLYIVSGKQTPRYAYTIGLSSKLGYEIAFAGGILYMYKEVGRIVRGIFDQVNGSNTSVEETFKIDSFGTFSLRSCDSSWVTLLMLGATDFYQRPDIMARQIVPDADHMTIDIPDMTLPWGPHSAPVWQWIREPWTYSVPSDSEAVTDLDALRGCAVTEACRWEQNYWELFAGEGPEIPKEDQRVVGLGMLLAADPSLLPILDLKIGDGIWREEDMKWHVWETQAGK